MYDCVVFRKAKGFKFVSDAVKDDRFTNVFDDVGCCV